MPILADLLSLRETAQQFLEAITRTQRERELAPIVEELEYALAKAWRRQGALFVNSLEEWRGKFPEEIKEALDYPEWWPLLELAMYQTFHAFLDPIDAAIIEAYLMGGGALVGTVGMPFSFTLANPRAQAYIEEYGARLITKINETTRDQIHTILKDASEGGWGYDKTAKAITERFDEFAIGKPQEHIRSRAHLVAVTESGNAYEAGNFEAAVQLSERGMAMEKKWVNVGDDKVSDGCLANSAVGWIPLLEQFPSNDPHPLRFPGCRCHAQYRRKRTGT